VTLGTPIGLFVANRDMRPGDYKALSNIPRPSHADYTYQMKYGIRASSGGGRASARETVGRVLEAYGIEIVAWVQSVGTVDAGDIDAAKLTRADVDSTAVRCPDEKAAEAMTAAIEKVKAASDSVGGTVSCICRGVPAGWGEPVFDKLEAMLAQGMLSIPATKGFEIGSGFAGTSLRGSDHNDPYINKGRGLGTRSNRSGGVQGGISNGEPVVFRVAFKPPATIGLPQETVDFDGRKVTLEAKGRHDPCVVPRAVPIVEGMAALVLADLALRQRAREKPHEGVDGE
jgi:chorismate synthase